MFKVISVRVGPTATELTSGVTIDQPTVVKVMASPTSNSNNEVFVGDSPTSCYWVVQPYVVTQVGGGGGYTNGSDVGPVTFLVEPGDKVYAMGSGQAVVMFYGKD